MGLNAALNMIDPESKQFFIRRTARELIWGYDDTLSAFARYDNDNVIRQSHNKFKSVVIFF
jgi:hypothetical protein